jgi:Sulfite exporter TauE/SafE
LSVIDDLPSSVEHLEVAVLLIAGTLSLARKPLDDQAIRPPRKPVALAWEAVIGLASGLTGVGGGVLITPLLLFCRWSSTRAASVSALAISSWQQIFRHPDQIAVQARNLITDCRYGDAIAPLRGQAFHR